MSKTKEKKNVFKTFARLNSKDKKPKKGKPKNWIFGLSVVGLTILSTGLAVGFTSNKRNLLHSVDKDAVAYVITKPNNQEIKVTVGDVAKASEGFFNTKDGQFALAKREVNLYLYEEEYEASKVFQKAWDSSKKEGEASRNFIIDSLDEIRSKQRKSVEDKKRTFQKTFSVNNWENEWKKELAKEELGKSASDEQAIEFLTLKAIQTQAFSRWTPKIEDGFTKYDIEERKAKDDIDTTDKNGNKIIVFPKGERIFKNMINTSNTAAKPEDVNGFLPNVLGQQVTESSKVSAFITRSFIPQFIKADELIQTYLTRFGTAFNASEVIINVKQDITNASLPWTITKKDLLELLSYKVIEFSESKALKVKQNIELLLDFKGTQNTSQEGKDEDNLLLNSINSNTNATNYLGARPLRNIFEVYKNEDASYANGYLTNVFSAIEKPNFFSELLSNIREAFFKDNKDIIMPTSASLSNKTANEIEQLNLILEREINKKSDAEITQLAGGAFRDLFATSIEDKRVSTVYKIADNKYVFLSTKGIHYVLLNKIATVNDFKKLIAQQVQLKANEQLDVKQKPTTDVVQTFSFFNSEDQIFSHLIRNEVVQKKVVDNILKDGSEQAKEDLKKNLVKQGLNLHITYFINKALESQTKVEEYIKMVVDNNLNSDYVLNESTGQFVIKGQENKGTAVALLYKELKNKAIKENN